jgi:methylated-DNA-protein-cysteine methyltransferase-like protein
VPTEFYNNVINVIRKIPKGKVATYSQIASYAGSDKGARGVSWILHSSSGKYKLPWHRVIGEPGKISLKPGKGLERQRSLLRKEGVEVDFYGKVNLHTFRWKPKSLKSLKRP